MIRFSLEGIEALDAIARTGTFAGAAEALHKAQSAVSYAVRQLEDQLGVALFDRSGHRARLTPAGVALLEEGRGLLARAHRVEGLARDFAAGWEPRLTVVVDGVLPMRPLMEALRVLDQEGVPTQVQITMEYLGGVKRRFLRDHVDLMLVTDAGFDPAHVAHALPPEVLVRVAAPDHPVHAAGPHDDASLRTFLELAIQDSDDELRDASPSGRGRVFYVSDFRTKLDGLRMGLGFGWMPVRLVSDELAAGRLREVEHRQPTQLVLTPSLVWRAELPLGRTGRRLVELVLAAWGDARAAR